MIDFERANAALTNALCAPTDIERAAGLSGFARLILASGADPHSVLVMEERTANALRSLKHSNEKMARENMYLRRHADSAVLKNKDKATAIDYRWDDLLDLAYRAYADADDQLPDSWQATVRQVLGVTSARMARWESGREAIPDAALATLAALPASLPVAVPEPIIIETPDLFGPTHAASAASVRTRPFNRAKFFDACEARGPRTLDDHLTLGGVPVRNADRRVWRQKAMEALTAGGSHRHLAGTVVLAVAINRKRTAAWATGLPGHANQERIISLAEVAVQQLSAVVGEMPDGDTKLAFLTLQAVAGRLPQRLTVDFVVAVTALADELFDNHALVVELDAKYQEQVVACAAHMRSQVAVTRALEVVTGLLHEKSTLSTSALGGL